MAGSRQRQKSKNKNNAAQQREIRAVEEEFGLQEPLPTWYKIIMFGLMIIGLLWIVVFYIGAGAVPIAAAGGWNIVIGFAFILAGFLMTMRWR